jgi:hypothetical protein
MQITQSTSFTITVNGQNYSFDSEHPIVDLISQNESLTTNLNLWQSRTIETQAQLDDVNAKIQALCTTPV